MDPKFLDADGIEDSFSTLNADGMASIYFQCSPDNDGTYHPGDNFKITAICGDSSHVSGITTTWKKMRIEYDCFSGCDLPDTAWWVMERIYKGENLSCFGSLDNDRNPYIEVNKSLAMRSDVSITPIVIDTTVATLSDFRQTYRNNSEKYPLYLVAADTLKDFPYALGLTWTPADNITNKVSFVFVQSIYNRYFTLHSLDSIDLRIGCTAAHELGHFAAYLHDTTGALGYEHFSLNCLMVYRNFTEILTEPRFCDSCVYHFRGNPKKRGPIIF